MKKKFMYCFIVIAVIMLISSCNAGPAAPASQTPELTQTPEQTPKGVINIYALKSDMQGITDKFLELHPDFGYTINLQDKFGVEYELKLDGALAAGGSSAPDIYCAEPSFVTRYTQGDMSGYAMPYDELGIDLETGIEAADIAQYIADVGTRPSDGKLVGLAYQSTAGVFIYRRSIAKDTWGTDDPAVIASKIGPGWDKFFEAAADLKKKDYCIVSGIDDIWRPAENSADKGWIVDGKLYIDPEREAYLDYSKKLIDNGYSNDTSAFQSEWYNDISGSGPRPVFGFFGLANYVDSVLAEYCGVKQDDKGETVKVEGTYGDWAICEPTAGFFRGGTWVLANKELSGDPEKKAAAAELINWMTLDCTESGLQYALANGTLFAGSAKDTVASGTVMGMSDGTHPLLGGQNMFDVFVRANKMAKGGNTTQYDGDIYPIWNFIVFRYSHGGLTLKQAIDGFKKNVKEKLGFDAWSQN